MAKFDKNLEYKSKNSWSVMDKTTKEAVFALAEEYKQFIDNSKTEREAVDNAVAMLKNNGFISIEEAQNIPSEKLAGTKLYYIHHNRSLFISVLGNNAPETGFKIVGAHVDCPRLDIKPHAFSEKSDMLYFKTHYYGGIRSYQWPTIPLALHGVIYTADGNKISVKIGENDDEPKFMISDLLPHLAHKMATKPMNDFIDPENLTVLIGSMPGEEAEGEDEETFSTKQNILTYLFERYGITESDFIKAELTMTPAAKAIDIGFDRALISGYGQDDRVCAFTELKAIMEIEGTPETTAVAYFSDKEEIGSVGNTGARSNALEIFVAEVCALYTPKDVAFTAMRCLSNSKMLSADVTAAYDPMFSEVYDESNAAFLAHGVALEKYTGHGGKYGTTDCSSEFLNEITACFDKDGVAWQLNEMGKIGAGGGGTIAQYMADKGVEVVDIGVPLFSMHAPMEISSKADVYWAYKAYKSFLK